MRFRKNSIVGSYFIWLGRLVTFYSACVPAREADFYCRLFFDAVLLVRRLMRYRRDDAVWFFSGLTFCYHFAAAISVDSGHHYFYGRMFYWPAVMTFLTVWRQSLGGRSDHRQCRPLVHFQSAISFLSVFQYRADVFALPERIR